MGIAENIARLRRKYDMTQAEFGEIAGVTDRAVSSWEKGLAEPRMGALQKLADHFGIKKSELIEDDDPPAAPAPNALDLIAKEYGTDTKQALELYVRLDAEDRSEIRGAMKFAFRADKYKIKEGLKIG